MLSLANLVTAIRFFGAPSVPILVYLYWPFLTSGQTAALLLWSIFLGCTDLVDGRVARMTGRVTDFGKSFDPIADFVFCLSLLVAHQIVWWRQPIAWLALAFALYFFWYADTVRRLRKEGKMGPPIFAQRAGMFSLMFGLMLAFGSSLLTPYSSIGHALAIALVIIAVFLSLYSLEKNDKRSEPRH